jgi:hypothetical protein
MKVRYIAAATAALLVLSPSVANAAPPAASAMTVVDGLVGPLHLAVGPDKVVTVSEEFASTLTKVRGGTKTPSYSSPEWDVSGVAYRGSTLYFLESQGAGPDDARPLAGSLKALDRNRVTTITDKLGAYETSRNPDRNVQYGLSPAQAAAHPGCVAQLGAVGFPASYSGELDSHPYALAVEGNTAYIADAGMNAILSVNLRTGSIHTVAVLPARPHTLTAAEANGFGLSDCAGLTYNFEFVPTDVEMGPDGWLYVSSLPGGPEDASLGARGAVFRVNPNNGRTQPYVTGILSPTGIALDRSGNLYIASLFGAGIYKVACGSHEARLFLPAVQAADVEVSGSTLYATTGAFGNGTLISLRL